MKKTVKAAVVGPIKSVWPLWLAALIVAAVGAVGVGIAALVVSVAHDSSPPPSGHLPPHPIRAPRTCDNPVFDFCWTSWPKR